MNVGSEAARDPSLGGVIVDAVLADRLERGATQYLCGIRCRDVARLCAQFVAVVAPSGLLKVARFGWQSIPMRVNLITEPCTVPASGHKSIPIFLTIRPACGLPGDYEYRTDSSALMRLLRKGTDLSSPVLQRFETNLLAYDSARLLAVELNDSILMEIGYFVE